MLLLTQLCGKTEVILEKIPCVAVTVSLAKYKICIIRQVISTGQSYIFNKVLLVIIYFLI